MVSLIKSIDNYRQNTVTRYSKEKTVVLRYKMV